MVRLMIYDQTTLEDGLDVKTDALAYSWKFGSKLYKTFRMLDQVKGVSSWNEALNWIYIESLKEPISMIQFWGHGSPGRAYIGNDVLSNDDTWTTELKKIGANLTDDCVFWFRTCSTFAGDPGLKFAKELSKKLDCRVAGHTHIITFFHSGLHVLAPNETPHWSANEGVEHLSADGVYEMKKSAPFIPNTITCLRGSIPKNLK